MIKTVILVFLSLVAVGLANDKTAECRENIRQTCNQFQQCCSRACGGPHQATCSESGGRISQASCRCEGRGSIGSGSTHSGHSSPGHADFGQQNTDQSNICRLAAEGSCNTFRSCCENRCGRPARLTCSARGTVLTESVCHCPPGSRPGSPTGSGGHSDWNTTPRYGHGGSGSFGSHTTPRYGSHGGLSESMGEEDYTHTCSRNYHDCTSFRSCCQNRCAGRTIQTQCQESGRTLKNTLCKCGRQISG